MFQERTKGFVVGSDTTPAGRKVWKVRVKDPESPYNEQKLVVASVRGGLELAQGLNVHFAIGTVDNASGNQALRAVDICLEPPHQTPSRSQGQETSS